MRRQRPALKPLFPVEEVREAARGQRPAPAEPRHGHVWPITALFGIKEQPTVIIEVAFYPVGDVPEPLSDEAWSRFCEVLGLTPLAGPHPLGDISDGEWQVEVGPHICISNPARRVQLVVPRPGGAWEEALQANGSCAVVLGTGIGVDDDMRAIGMPSTAAILTPAHAGSWDVPELADIPGLYVVPLNSFRPYDPMRPVTFLLDTSVLIAMQRLCFAPERLGAQAQDVRHLVFNLLGRDVLPGPALSQLLQPTRATTEPCAALEALTAFDLLMAHTRAEIMDERRPPESFEAAGELEPAGADDLPQMLWMYAGTLRLRQLWSPSQTLPERAQSFEAFIQWLRHDLRLNAALLMQVAFNLWIADNAAHHQASRLLRFRSGPVTDATLGELWGTAYDLFLVSGQVDALQVPDVADVAILTLDRGLAGMRDFFEHVEIAELASGADAGPDFVWSSRVKLDLHPSLEHMRPRVDELADALHSDMLTRLATDDTSALDRRRQLALVEREERLVKQLP